jgi:hypothetical protein
VLPLAEDVQNEAGFDLSGNLLAKLAPDGGAHFGDGL